jgi:hypothetical protein
MANLILNGSTSGSITISSPAVSGTNTLTLPANTGTVITTASTFGGTGPAFNAYASSTTSIANTTWTKISINTVTFDTNSNFNTSNYRFTPTVAGYYQINGMAQLASTSQAYAIAIWKNGGAVSQASGIGASGLNGSANTSVVIYLNGSTDYVELYMYQTSGGSINANGGNNVTALSGSLIRSA